MRRNNFATTARKEQRFLDEMVVSALRGNKITKYEKSRIQLAQLDIAIADFIEQK